MKKLFLLFIPIIFLSCGHTTPKIGSDNYPFVVKKIEYYNENLSKYVGNQFADNNEFSVMGPALILPTGMFNIGDTILPQNFKK